MPNSRGRAKQVQTNWLQLVTQVVALFAGLATVVYLAGGVVLGLRLAFAGLPWGNVVSQLPRQFLISIGAGQILFPALLVGALYGLFRLLRQHRAARPNLRRWRDGGPGRYSVLWAHARTFAVMTVPLAAIVAVRLAGGDDLGESWFWWVGAGLLGLLGVAVAVHETRAALVRHSRGLRRWDGLRGGATMAGIYCVAAIPAMLVGAAAVPLTHAKVCDSDNFIERGFLVGETSDRVYLGEETDHHARRIAVIPFSQVNELFIGPDAKAADCELTSSPPSAREREAREKREKRAYLRWKRATVAGPG